MVKVYVVLVNYNNNVSTKMCLESLSYSDYRNFNVIIVDNSLKPLAQKKFYESLKSDLNFLSSYDDDLSKYNVIFSKENEGFGSACNEGVEFIHNIDEGDTYIWFLNNDCTVKNDSLSKLMANASSNTILGSKIIMPNQLVQCFGGGSLSRFTGKNRQIGFNYKISQTKPNLDISYITGASLLVNMRTFKNLRGFDKKFFLYWEEVDLCSRAITADCTMKCIEDSIVFHDVSSTNGVDSDLTLYYFNRNYMIFFGVNKLHRSYYFLIGLLRVIISSLIKKRTFPRFIQFKGLVDGYFGKVGKNEDI